MVVGASIGALNGAYYASRPDAEGVEELARLWLSVSSHDVYPVSGPDVLRTLAGNLPFHPVRGALQALGVLNYTFPLNPATLAAAMLGRRNYLFDNSSLRRFLERILPIRHLEETRTPLSVLTADVRTGRPVVLSRGPALPALLASTAIPALYPTVTIGDRMLMDGGVADLTTLDYAVDAGADEAYLLAPGFSCPCRRPRRPRSPWPYTATTCSASSASAPRSGRTRAGPACTCCRRCARSRSCPSTSAVRPT
ncbi:patatin-like phospholipase family protein [Microbispora sp. NPDC004025]